MTPLELLVGMLASEHNLAPPESKHPAQIRAWLLANARKDRERQIARYLIDAADGRLGPRGGRGSLKNLLWWLREYAGHAYHRLAQTVLVYALANADSDLESIAEELQRVPGLSFCARQALKGADKSELAESLSVQTLGDWRVAVNTTAANLLAVAMQVTDADLYVAASERGAVVKARKGIPFDMPAAVAQLDRQACGGWKLAHPDYAFRPRKGDAPPELTPILQVIQGMPRYG